jgi:hypothetical protein
VVEAARATWGGAAPPPAFEPPRRWVTIVPGFYLAPPASAAAQPAVALVTPDAQVRARPVTELVPSQGEDRLLLRLLAEGLACDRDGTRNERLGRWLAPHMGALGLSVGPCPKPGPGS